MSLIPAFEIGVWNAWILQVIFFIVLSAPSLLMNQEADRRLPRTHIQSKFYPTIASLTQALIIVCIIFTLIIPGCNQPDPISATLSLSEPPLLEKPIEVKLTFSLVKSYRGNATITAGIMLP